MDLTQITQIIPEPILWTLAVAALVALLTSLRNRRLGAGARGEVAVSRELQRYCVQVADDLILPDGRGGLAQVDHLALTADGLLVVETKNYSGLIFGQERDRTWTQCVGRQKNKFYNPLRQNYGHIKALKALAPEIPVTGLVVFLDKARFPKGYPKGVTTLSDLQRTLLPITGGAVSIRYRNAWEAVLRHVRTDPEARKTHLADVQLRKRGLFVRYDRDKPDGALHEQYEIDSRASAERGDRDPDPASRRAEVNEATPTAQYADGESLISEKSTPAPSSDREKRSDLTRRVMVWIAMVAVGLLLIFWRFGLLNTSADRSQYAGNPVVTRYVTSPGLNLRANSALDSQVIRILDHGEKVYIQGVAGGWYRVVDNPDQPRLVGWVDGEHTSLEKPSKP